MTDLIALAVGFLLTLGIYSYVVFGNQPPYRLSIHVFVGVSAAYASVVVVQQVIWPVIDRVRQNPTEPDNILWLIPFLMALLLLMRNVKYFDWIGKNILAFLMAVGAAVALFGAVVGTLWPQITAMPGQGRVENILIAILTISTLLTFQFTRRANKQNESWQYPGWQRIFVYIGRIVLTITFAVLYANVLNTSLVLLTERTSYFMGCFLQLLLN